MNFREAEEIYKRIKSQFENGIISHEEFRNRLKELVVRDKKGNIWMLGAKSGKWYMKTQQGWIEATPPVEETAPLHTLFTEEDTGDMGEEESQEMEAMEKEYTIRGLSPLSAALFLGGMGILFGVIVGAFAEALVPKFLNSIGLGFPGLGTLWKAFIYSLMTGVVSFVIFFIGGFILTLLINLVLEVFGGIRIFLS